MDYVMLHIVQDLKKEIADLKKENAEASTIQDLKKEIADLKKNFASNFGSDSDQGAEHGKKAPVKAYFFGDTLQKLKDIKEGENVKVAEFKIGKSDYSVEYAVGDATAVELNGNKIVITHPKKHIPSLTKEIEDYIFYGTRFTTDGNSITDFSDYNGPSALKCNLAESIVCDVEKAGKLPIDFIPVPESPGFNWLDVYMGGEL
jgi:hypothetical protein